MDVQKDYYAALGLKPSASTRDVKSAYRVLVRRYHPDTSPAPRARERFEQVQEAYEILIDPAKRRAYDRWRENEGLTQPQRLAVNATLSHRCLPLMDEEQVLYVLLEVSANPGLQTRRLPLNLCLVIDRSTSMRGARLQHVKDATNYIIDALEPQDAFSVVTFSDRAEVVIPAQSKIDKTFAKSRVSTIRSSGGTEILRGMLAGLGEIDRWRSPGLVNHMVLLTDGQTYGGEEQCIQGAKAAGRRQISISTMGIGQDWNDSLLDEIARQSGGTSTYIDHAARVVQVFRERIQGLATIVARDMSLTVRLHEHARIQQAYRVSPPLERLDVQGDKIHLGQLEAKRPLSLISEFAVCPQMAGTMYVAQLELTAGFPSLDGSEQTVKTDIEVDFVHSLNEIEQVPPAIVSTLGKLAIFRMQEKAMYELEQGESARASQRLETMATRLLSIGENELAQAALLEAGRLARTGQISAVGRKRIHYGTRSLSMPAKEVSDG
jgi:Ca-activated chloride channel family protein